MSVDAGGHDGAPRGDTLSNLHGPSIELTGRNDRGSRAETWASVATNVGCEPTMHCGSRRYRVTFGTFNQTKPWTEVRSLPLSELAALLTNHAVGQKAGTCITPAVFRTGRRTKADADQIDAAFLDSDAGSTLDEIRQALHRLGCTAIVSSTFSHLTSRSQVNRREWERFCQSTGGTNTPEAFLIREKGLRPEVAAGAELEAMTDELVTLRHRPCPKFRIAIPLLRSWIAADYADQDAANAAWRERLEALAATLGLPHDASCTDTSRLFYLPRRPADGPEPETAVVSGELLDLFDLPAAISTSDACGRRTKLKAADCSYIDHETGQVVDLVNWVRDHGQRFEIADALRARRPDLLLSKVSDRIKHHARCVNEDAHTHPGEDGATILINSSDTHNSGFVIHCRHAHCTGLDRLFFVKRMLERGWLLPDDLTNPALQAGREAVEERSDQSVPQHEPRQLLIGSDTEIAGRVAADLADRFGQVVYEEGEFWTYAKTHWQPIPVEELWKSAMIYDGATYRTPANVPSNVKLGQGRVQSIIACMIPMLTVRRFFTEAKTGINCASGFISFSEDGTPDLAAHCPSHRQRHVIRARWSSSRNDPTRHPTLLNRLLEGCFRGDEDQQAKIDLLAEVAGVAALGVGTRITNPKALICFGKKAQNGKSQVLAMLRSLLPKEAVSSISPASFGDKTFACHLAGKFLNAPDELGATEAIASETFKQIITGDPLMVRDVYKRAFDFEPCAQHVFATNNLPAFKGGMDRGVRRRVTVLVFNRVIPREERLQSIGRRIGDEEADLLLDWAVGGAGRVLARGSFTNPPSSAEALRDWVYSTDPVLGWLESEEVAFRDGDQIPETRVSIAHDKFVRWAEEEGFKADRLPAVNGFSQRVEASDKGVTKKRTSSGAWLIGLRCLGPGTNRSSGLGRR